MSMSSNESKDAIMGSDLNGNFLQSWGEEFAAGAHGLYLSRENGQEFLFLVDYAVSVVVKMIGRPGDFSAGRATAPNVYNADHPYKPTGWFLACRMATFMFVMAMASIGFTSTIRRATYSAPGGPGKEANQFISRARMASASMTCAAMSP